MIDVEKNPEVFDGWVTITQSRYEQLLDCETRIDVLINLINKDYGSVEVTDVCRILGYDKVADGVLKKIEEERKKVDEFLKELKEKEEATLKKIEEERGNEA